MNTKFTGKIVGGVAGFFLGGPIGALFGAVIGDLYDHTATTTVDADRRPSQEEFHRQMQDPDMREVVFIGNLVALLTSVAKADLHIDQREVEVIRRFFQTQFNYSAEDSRVIDNLIREAAQTRLDLRAICEDVKRFFNYGEMLLLLRIMYMVAYADKKLKESEKSRIDEIVRMLGISAGDHTAVYNEFRSSVPDYYSQLGVDASATDEEIKTTYRELVKKYHPDKVQHLGKEFSEIAREKFVKIQNAYEKIREERGL